MCAYVTTSRAASETIADGNAAPSAQPSSASARFPENAVEFDQLFEEIKNWGRWGPQDQLGALNLITPAKRKQAIALARLGQVVSLAHPLLTEGSEENGKPFEFTMNEGLMTDTYKFNYHGFLLTHLDALCHFPYKGKDYNGYPTETVNTPKGCAKLGVENLRNGIVTRGILIDIPRLKHVPYLEPGEPVFVEDLEAWEKQTHLKVSPGDAIFLRTGRWTRWAKVGPWSLVHGAAGFHPSVARWLKQRGVAVMGSDIGELMPSPVDGVFGPTHILAINALGIVLLDNHDLEALAETAARLKRWEFMLTVAPLPVTGGTGSPVNSLAIF